MGAVGGRRVAVPWSASRTFLRGLGVYSRRGQDEIEKRWLAVAWILSAWKSTKRPRVRGRRLLHPQACGRMR